ncbi:DUF2673 domain-containing protein [uncultured Nostoc sp.]|uniref:DUF2673 domain-containing protein n=1 Tax=uncultured Nostoc sp. TaxID=340711 RepID=UPI0035C959A0
MVTNKQGTSNPSKSSNLTLIRKIFDLSSTISSDRISSLSENKYRLLSNDLQRFQMAGGTKF